MNHITTGINELCSQLQPQDHNRHEQHSTALMPMSRKSYRPFAPESAEPFNGLELLPGDPISDETIAELGGYIQRNFGVKYDPVKWKALGEVIKRDEWTGERFQYTAEWFVKNHRFSAWTVADWFSFSVKCYTLPGKQKLLDQGNKNSDFECYKLPDGTLVWKLIDGQKLPFERFDPNVAYEHRFDDLADALEEAYRRLENHTAESYWKWWDEWSGHVEYIAEPRRTELKKKQTALSVKFAPPKQTWIAKPERGSLSRRKAQTETANDGTQAEKKSKGSGSLVSAADFAKRCEEFAEERREREQRRIEHREGHAESVKAVEPVASAEPDKSAAPLKPAAASAIIAPVTIVAATGPAGPAVSAVSAEPVSSNAAPKPEREPHERRKTQHNRHASPDHPRVHLGMEPVFSKHIDFI